MPAIQITMSQGRSVEQKRELIKVLTKETARSFKRKLGERRSFRYRYV